MEETYFFIKSNYIEIKQVIHVFRFISYNKFKQ